MNIASILHHRPSFVHGLVLRAGFFAFLWCVLAERDPWREWPLAVGAIAAATAASVVCWPAGRFHLRAGAMLRFAPWFLWQSLRGGIDVARRAFDPRMPLRPALVELSLRTPNGFSHVVLAWVLSLLPGTATVRAGDGWLTVHVLDERLYTVESLHAVETWVAKIFGQA